MSKLREVLQELRATPGVKGAAIITADGLVADSVLDERFRAEVVAGLSSYLLMTTNRSLRESGLGEASRFVIHATHGKAVCVPFQGSFLVALCDQFADFQAAVQEVDAAAKRLRSLARLG